MACFCSVVRLNYASTAAIYEVKSGSIAFIVELRKLLHNEPFMNSFCCLEFSGSSSVSAEKMLNHSSRDVLASENATLSYGLFFNAKISAYP
jgi:hypothetical protein